ncbi:hypothetical protein PG997_003371 [Apiospora hydei]|uniref:Zn(2)-C6 fungal-type domain-containing protein n=1 Tax=Apiospora hydei TaxID=1337664 RepID=A0ABR1WZ52_9PEZI
MAQQRCDAAKPTCKRCTQSRRPCLWKKKVLDIHFENQYASGHQRRPRGPRPALPSGAGHPQQPGSSSSTNSRDGGREGEGGGGGGGGTTIPPPLHLSLQVQAVTFYLNHYMRPLPPDALSVTRSLDDYICHLSAASPSSALLDAAIRCMALETYSRVVVRGQDHDARVSAEAAHHYQLLLSLSRRSVARLDAANLDECLLGVFFLSRFDASTHGLADLWRKLRASPAHHYHGAMALLQYWKEHLRDERDGTGSGGSSPVIQESRRGLLRFLLMHGLDVPDWMKDGEIFGEAGFELVHDRVTVWTADLRHRVLRLLRPTEIPSEPRVSMAEVLSDLNREAQVLDRMLRDWVRQFQRSWLYQQHTLPPSDDPKRAQRVPSPSKVYTYSKLSYALLWSKYAALRLLVNDTHLKIVLLCSEALVATDPSIECQCQLVVEQMTDIVVSSNAFIVGGFARCEYTVGRNHCALERGVGRMPERI